MNNKDLYLEDGSTIKWFPKSKEYYLNKATIVYGRTQSGKSTIVKEIMYLCKDDISLPFVVSQSSISNSDFDNILPKNCIKREISKEWLEEFLLNQKGRTTLYKTANDMKILKQLFNKVRDTKHVSLETKILNTARRYIHNIETSTKLEYAVKKQQITEINIIQAKQLTKLYKDTIRSYKFDLDNIAINLSREELSCLNYLDFIPHALLIFDDCASIFKKWVKETTVLKEIFYNGRHYNITIIVTAQDDKEIDSELRKNAIVNVFTTHQAATANFDRTSNNYPKHEKKRAGICIKKIFDSGAHNSIMTKNHKKLIYLQNNPGDPFLYTIADIYEDFKLGCKGVWELDKKIEETKQTHDIGEIQSFYDKYEL